MDLYKSMQSASLEIDAVTLSSLMTACKKSGHCKEALQLFDEVKGLGVRPNIICYNSLISTLRSGGRWEMAMQVLQRLKETPGLEPDVVTYSALVSVCERAGQVERALELYEEMKAKGIRNNGCVALPQKRASGSDFIHCPITGLNCCAVQSLNVSEIVFEHRDTVIAQNP